MIGRRFGFLTVVAEAPSRYDKRRVRVRCDCGAERTVHWQNMVRLLTKSCGRCWSRQSRVVHGQSAKRMPDGGRIAPTPTYISWNNMRINSRRYGISLDPRWTDFRNFFHDLGERPAHHMLRRIEPDDGFTPDNCQWIRKKDRRRRRSI